MGSSSRKWWEDHCHKKTTQLASTAMDVDMAKIEIYGIGFQSSALSWEGHFFHHFSPGKMSDDRDMWGWTKDASMKEVDVLCHLHLICFFPYLQLSNSVYPQGMQLYQKHITIQQMHGYSTHKCMVQRYIYPYLKHLWAPGPPLVNPSRCFLMCSCMSFRKQKWNF